jgi:hypothetical protein
MDELQAVLKQIAGLDDARAAGTLPDEAYASQRAALKQRAVELARLGGLDRAVMPAQD